MSQRVYNFGAGPAMLPTEVMEEVQQEMLDYQGHGASIIEISHRAPPFLEILEKTESIFRRLTGLGSSHVMFFMHGGAQMQFSAVPLNLMARKEKRSAVYLITGKWGVLAEEEARKFGSTRVALDGKPSGFRKIPEWEEVLDPETSYVHLTSNNTLYGTQWQEYPDTGKVPLVSDSTSDILSRKEDYSRFGLVYAGLQKNLGPSGLALVLVREDLLGLALPQTPKLLDYQLAHEQRSLANTTSVFSIYVTLKMLRWVEKQGGVAVMEQRNREKSNLLYDVLDDSELYKAVADPENRSICNVTFRLDDDEMEKRFLKQSLNEGLYALKGHRDVGGIRASIYNSMPLEGVIALADFMKDFERRET